MKELIDRLRAEIDRTRPLERVPSSAHLRGLMTEAADAIEDLHKDAERLDWLVAQGPELGVVVECKEGFYLRFLDGFTHERQDGYYPTARAAIDAEMGKKEPQSQVGNFGDSAKEQLQQRIASAPLPDYYYLRTIGKEPKE